MKTQKTVSAAKVQPKAAKVAKVKTPKTPRVSGETDFGGRRDNEEIGAYTLNSRAIRQGDGISEEGKGKSLPKGAAFLACYGVCYTTQAGLKASEALAVSTDPRKLAGVTIGKFGKLVIVRRTTPAKDSGNPAENALSSADGGKTWQEFVIRSNAKWTQAKRLENVADFAQVAWSK